MDKGTSLNLISIEEYGSKLSRRLASAVGIALISIGVPSVIVLTLALQTWSIDRVVQSVETHLVSAIKTGDQFQLSRTLRSLVSNDLFEGAEIYDENGLLISSGSPSEFNNNAGLLSFRLNYPLVSSGAVVGQLLIQARFPVFILLVFMIVLGVFTVVLKSYAQRILLRMGREISQPLIDFPLVLQGEMPTQALRLNELFTLHKEVSELRMKEKELDRVQAEKQQSQALAQLAAQVAHDIRSPLSALQAITKKMESSSTDEAQIITKVAARISSIANDLLHKNRSPVAQELAPIDLKDVVVDILNERAGCRSETKEITIHSDLKTNELYIVKADKSELLRVLSNLINNSEESIERSGQITVALRTSRKDVSLIVMDNGKGIPEEKLKEVGTRGVTFGKDRSGNGLGLSHAIETIRRYGGDLRIQSKEGAGTIVTAIFPRVLQSV